jgi:MinD superfamily P-loop ATPase
MKEIVIISGKGGTGKTSLTAALATLAGQQGKAVFADCDVDAADLHLVLGPKIQERNEFISGHVARVDPKRCLSSGEDGSCAKCIDLCRFGAISHSFKTGCAVDEGSCEGCGVCVRFCPSSAIEFAPRRCGEWYVSQTRFGPLAHAALDARAENSGKLVTTVRKEAKRIAEELKADWIIVDGSPGTGCPVIASITGADEVVIVTEPTMSGRHDLERVAGLARHFSIPFSVVVNKADINRAMADETGAWCARNAVPFLGMIPYDRAVTKAQLEGKSVIEYCDCGGESENDIPAIIGGIWESICQSKR